VVQPPQADLNSITHKKMPAKRAFFLLLHFSLEQQRKKE
jgi:hypothetical protein